MYTYVHAADVQGLKARSIRIEVDVRDGLPVFEMVGYLASSVKEAKDRVRIAVNNLGFRFPAKRITINLSPANIKKDGTSFDLPIAVALLLSFDVLPENSAKDTLFIGELGLDGRVHSVNGVLAMIMKSREEGIRRFVVPSDNVYEGAVLDDVEVIGVTDLEETVLFLKGEKQISPVRCSFEEYMSRQHTPDDFSDIVGQSEGKLAAEIAVSGHHNMLMIGPPGSGKSMLAKRIPTIMPLLTREECLEITRIYSICGLLSKERPLITERPFRAPHHTCTQTALTGGGNRPKPGEITLAAKGILFLDELPEYAKATIEVLRQPMEEGHVTVSRLNGSEDYPCDCIFMAAMNPCRCGFFPDRNKCRCTIGEIHKYLDKVSEPLLDRMDIGVELKVPAFGLYERAGESSAEIRARVEKTMSVQQKRYANETYSYNGEIPIRDMEKYCPLGKEEMGFLRDFFEEEECSMRRLTRIVRVARTIADREGERDISSDHIALAISLRSIDKKYWGGERYGY